MSETHFVLGSFWKNHFNRLHSASCMVQNSRISGNSTDPLPTPETGGAGLLSRGLLAGIARVSQQLQPVRLLGPGQQLRRTLSHPFRMLAPQEPPVIEEELQQRQVVRAQ